MRFVNFPLWEYYNIGYFTAILQKVDLIRTIHCFNINISLDMCVVINKRELLPVESGLIIGRFCLGADSIVHIDRVIHMFGVIGHVHIGAVIVWIGIGLKYTCTNYRSLINSWIAFKEKQFTCLLKFRTVSIPCRV